MTSEEYKLYNLEDEIKKYTELNNTIVVNEDNNDFNKNKVRDDFVDILRKKLKIPELQAKDLEIGVFNATIDYANNYGIQLSWKSQILLDTYINISRSIYSNIKKDSYIGNKNLHKRMLKYVTIYAIS
jgi:hypothetical protein